MVFIKNYNGKAFYYQMLRRFINGEAFYYREMRKYVVQNLMNSHFVNGTIYYPNSVNGNFSE